MVPRRRCSFVEPPAGDRLQDKVRVPDNRYRGQLDWQQLCPSLSRALISQNKHVGGERELEGVQSEPWVPRQHFVIQIPRTYLCHLPGGASPLTTSTRHAAAAWGLSTLSVELADAVGIVDAEGHLDEDGPVIDRSSSSGESSRSHASTSALVLKPRHLAKLYIKEA
ncbi:unnamed protein product [Merluccius merluccius]